MSDMEEVEMSDEEDGHINFQPQPPQQHLPQAGSTASSSVPTPVNPVSHSEAHTPAGNVNVSLAAAAVSVQPRVKRERPLIPLGMTSSSVSLLEDFASSWNDSDDDADDDDDDMKVETGNVAGNQGPPVFIPISNTVTASTTPRIIPISTATSTTPSIATSTVHAPHISAAHPPQHFPLTAQTLTVPVTASSNSTASSPLSAAPIHEPAAPAPLSSSVHSSPASVHSNGTNSSTSHVQLTENRPFLPVQLQSQCEQLRSDCLSAVDKICESTEIKARRALLIDIFEKPVLELSGMLLDAVIRQHKLAVMAKWARVSTVSRNLEQQPLTDDDWELQLLCALSAVAVQGGACVNNVEKLVKDEKDIKTFVRWIHKSLPAYVATRSGDLNRKRRVARAMDKLRELFDLKPL